VQSHNQTATSSTLEDNRPVTEKITVETPQQMTMADKGERKASFSLERCDNAREVGIADVAKHN